MYTGHQFIFCLSNEIDNGLTNRKDVLFISISLVSPPEAYVHGVMDGEAIDVQDNEDIPAQWFELQ